MRTVEVSQLFTRYKARAIGMPSINSRNGGKDVPNYQLIQASDNVGNTTNFKIKVKVSP